MFDLTDADLSRFRSLLLSFAPDDQSVFKCAAYVLDRQYDKISLDNDYTTFTLCKLIEEVTEFRCASTSTNLVTEAIQIVDVCLLSLQVTYASKEDYYQCSELCNKLITYFDWLKISDDDIFQGLRLAWEKAVSKGPLTALRDFFYIRLEKVLLESS